MASSAEALTGTTSVAASLAAPVSAAALISELSAEPAVTGGVVSDVVSGVAFAVETEALAAGNGSTGAGRIQIINNTVANAGIQRNFGL